MLSPSTFWGELLFSALKSHCRVEPERVKCSSEVLVNFGKQINCLEWVDFARKKHPVLNQLPKRLLLASKGERGRCTIVNRSLSQLMRKIENQCGTQSFCFLKGGAFLKRGEYPTGIRRMYDIDILIDKKDISQWHSILNNLGFQPVVSIKKLLKDQFIKTHSTVVYYGIWQNRRVLIDVHWHLMDSVPHRATGIWNFSLEPIWDSVTDKVMSPEHRLIFASLHAFKHRFHYWKSLIDMIIIEQQQALDWDWLVEEAKRMKAIQILHISNSVLNSISGISLTIPDNVLLTINQRWKSYEKKIVSRAAKRETLLLDFILPSLLLHNSWKTKAHFLFRFLFPPLLTLSEGEDVSRSVWTAVRTYFRHFRAVFAEIQKYVRHEILSRAS